MSADIKAAWLEELVREAGIVYYNAVTDCWYYDDLPKDAIMKPRRRRTARLIMIEELKTEGELNEKENKENP